MTNNETKYVKDAKQGMLLMEHLYATNATMITTRYLV